MTTLELVKAMQVAGMPMERIAAAIGCRTAIVDYACWLALDGSEISKVRACRLLDTNREKWS